MEGDRLILKTLDGKQSYKYSHDRLEKVPDNCIPAELDVCRDDKSSDNDDMSIGSRKIISTMTITFVRVSSHAPRVTMLRRSVKSCDKFTRAKGNNVTILCVVIGCRKTRFIWVRNRE